MEEMDSRVVVCFFLLLVIRHRHTHMYIAVPYWILWKQFLVTMSAETRFLVQNNEN